MAQHAFAVAGNVFAFIVRPDNHHVMQELFSDNASFPTFKKQYLDNTFPMMVAKKVALITTDLTLRQFDDKKSILGTSLIEMEKLYKEQTAAFGPPVFPEEERYRGKVCRKKKRHRPDATDAILHPISSTAAASIRQLAEAMPLASEFLMTTDKSDAVAGIKMAAHASFEKGTAKVKHDKVPEKEPHPPLAEFFSVVKAGSGQHEGALEPKPAQAPWEEGALPAANIFDDVDVGMSGQIVHAGCNWQPEGFAMLDLGDGTKIDLGTVDLGAFMASPMHRPGASPARLAQASELPQSSPLPQLSPVVQSPCTPSAFLEQVYTAAALGAAGGAAASVRKEAKGFTEEVRDGIGGLNKKVDDGIGGLNKKLDDGFKEMRDGFDGVGSKLDCEAVLASKRAALATEHWSTLQEQRRQELVKQLAEVDSKDAEKKSARENARADATAAAAAAANHIIANAGSAAAAQARAGAFEEEAKKLRAENASLKRKGREGLAATAHMERMSRAAPLSPAFGNGGGHRMR